MISPEDFREEVRKLAAEMKADFREIQLRPLKTRWGSCSLRGRLTFDTQLLSESAEFRRRVIIHELLHLTIHNHGKFFKLLERSYLKRESRTATLSAANPGHQSSFDASGQKDMSATLIKTQGD